jgi:casein kinase II subunit beta
MSSSSQIMDTWISNFCNMIGHEYFAEVAEDFIEDDFNLTGLQSQVPLYKEALEMILDVEPDDEDDDDDEEEEDEDEDMGGTYDYRGVGGNDRRHFRMSSDASVIEGSAELLYGLIHQRYITSRPGIQQMLEKYELGHFGNCPRVLCNGAKVIPVGRTDTPGQDTVKLFCPSCLDVYTPPNSRFQQIDGAFFGTTFGCLFFMTFPDLDIGVPHASEDRLALPMPPVNNGNGETASLSGSMSSTVIATPTASIASPAITQHLPPQPSTMNGVATANFAAGLGSVRTGQIYEPRVYGFRVSERSRSGPRMQWLRMKPADINELDEVRLFVEQENHDGDQTISVVDGVEELADSLTLTSGGVHPETADVQDQEMAEPQDARRRSARPIAKATTRKSARKAPGDGNAAEANGVGEVG